MCVCRDMAMRGGVPEEKILIEDKASNTIENFVCSAPIIRAQGGVQRVVLVTSDYHMHRAQTIANEFLGEYELVFEEDHPPLSDEQRRKEEAVERLMMERILKDLSRYRQ